MSTSDARDTMQEVIEKHTFRLNAVREQVAMANDHVEQLLRNKQRPSWTLFESSQAQLVIYLRRAERQVETLTVTKKKNLVAQEQALNTTWDELALATQRLVSRIREESEMSDEQT